MGGRLQQLNASTGGINRLRIKGGPKPTNLYDLVNGYVDASGAPTSRPGTVQDIALPEGTKGLAAFNGGLVVFSHLPLSTGNPKYTVETIGHPTIPTAPLLEIHFAGPFLGYLYVVAEFVNNDVFHYWLQQRTPWAANTVYREGDVVEPTTPNGFAYRATRLTPAGVAWAPDVARTVGDKVEPTVSNGYEYTVIDTYGANPRSGSTEPTWPESDGATVIEDTDGVLTSTPTSPTDPSTTLPEDVEDRYGTGMSGRSGTDSQAVQ